MPKRARCNSKWKTIKIIDHDGDVIKSFKLNKLGQLLHPFQRMKRRAIHSFIQNNLSKSDQNSSSEEKTHENSEYDNSDLYRDEQNYIEFENQFNILFFDEFMEKPTKDDFDLTSSLFDDLFCGTEPDAENLMFDPLSE